MGENSCIDKCVSKYWQVNNGMCFATSIKLEVDLIPRNKYTLVFVSMVSHNILICTCLCKLLFMFLSGNVGSLSLYGVMFVFHVTCVHHI